MSTSTKPPQNPPAEPKPQETKPEDTKPEDTKPEDTNPEDTNPEDSKSEELDPEPLTGNETDAEVAKKLTIIIERANERMEPLLKAIKEHLTAAERDKENDCLDEAGLVKSVKPLLEEATAILRETHGAIKALDPDGSIANNATRKTSDHDATKEEQHLAEALGKLTGDVTNAIEEAKKKIAGMPKVEKDLGPLLEALSEPLFQIVSGVGLLLNGVLSLLGNILDGLGLGGLVRGLLSGLGLEKVMKGLGLTGLFPGGGDKKKKK